MKTILKTREIIAIALLSLFVILPNSVYGAIFQISHQQEIDKLNQEEVRLEDAYLYINSEGVVQLDIKKAIANGESEDTVEICRMANDILASYQNAEQNIDGTEEVASHVPAFAFWGNWCGPSYGSGTPIDILDEGCRRHDNCYVHGGNNCACNQRLISYIDQNYHKMTGGQKVAAQAVRLAFSLENKLEGC